MPYRPHAGAFCAACFPPVRRRFGKHYVDPQRYPLFVSPLNLWRWRWRRLAPVSLSESPGDSVSESLSDPEVGPSTRHDAVGQPIHMASSARLRQRRALVRFAPFCRARYLLTASCRCSSRRPFWRPPGTRGNFGSTHGHAIFHSSAVARIATRSPSGSSGSTPGRVTLLRFHCKSSNSRYAPRATSGQSMVELAKSLGYQGSRLN